MTNISEGVNAIHDIEMMIIQDIVYYISMFLFFPNLISRIGLSTIISK